MNAKLLSIDRPVAIYYIFTEDVASITEHDKDTKIVTLKQGKAWNLINTTIGTIDLQEPPELSRAGTIHSSTLNASCPGHDDNTPGDIAAISGRKALIRIDYKSGMKKLIGDLEAAPRLFIKVTSNTTTSRKLISDWKSSQPNYWLQ